MVKLDLETPANQPCDFRKFLFRRFSSTPRPIQKLLWFVLGDSFIPRFSRVKMQVEMRHGLACDFSLPEEFFVFGLKQARASVFAGSFLALLVVGRFIHISGLSYADVLFIGAILIQIALIISKLETVDEAKVILLFHFIGLLLELYKTNPAIGSWTYPDPGIFHIMNVPLYSGFMYASIGSYMAQAWKVFRLELLHVPSYRSMIIVCGAIYLNFFTNHFIYDLRWFLAAAVIALFWKTRVQYSVVAKKRRSMPLVLSFALIGFFVWIAENIGTFYGAWKYPHQINTWSAVSFHKVSSWSLLVIISFIIVAYLKHTKASLHARRSAAVVETKKN